MVLILIPDLLLLSALAVSYCLPLRTFSAPPAVTHKHIFRAGVSNKIQQQKSSESKESPTAAQHFAFIQLLEPQAEVKLWDSSQGLCLFYPLPAAHKSHTSSSSRLASAAAWGDPAPRMRLCQLEKWLRWTEMQQAWVSAASGGRRMKILPPVHPLMTRHHGDVRRYRGDKHRHTFLPSFSFFPNFYLENVIKILFQFWLQFTQTQHELSL